MSLSKLRLSALGLLAAGLGAAAVLGGGLPQWHPTPAAAQKAPNEHGARSSDGGVLVEAPHAKVDVDKERGTVRVKAPYTDVSVDPDKGRVRVRAPYVDLDIRW